MDEHEQGWIPVVVGRYPANANECNLLVDSTPTNFSDNTRQDIERDPFDYYNDDMLTFVGPSGNQIPIEVYEETPGGFVHFGYDNNRELQRGFSVYGNHMVETQTITDSSGVEQEIDVFCFGSNWSIYDIQEQIAVPGFEYNASDDTTPVGLDDTGRYLPNQGLVLVEIYWQHRLLLNLPVFSPVMQALGDDQTTLYVWSVFPVPTAEPNIVYP